MNFALGSAVIFQPLGEGLYVIGADGNVILIAEHVLQQDFERVGQAGEIRANRLARGVDTEIVIVFTGSRQGAAGFQGIVANMRHSGISSY